VSDLTFARFQKLNAARCAAAFHPVDAWPIQNWALAIAGEAGELCNRVKKVIRGDYTLAEQREEILKELADVITYCDLAVSHLNADTATILMAKFDEVSARVGWKS
jgi:NTP pyrophosphatase (non-canonical NTP hydrolase)